jgi:hypothetical protein
MRRQKSRTSGFSEKSTYAKTVFQYRSRQGLRLQHTWQPEKYDQDGRAIHDFKILIFSQRSPQPLNRQYGF